MRHKAPRPLVDWWRRLPRATARLLGEAAGPRPFHALMAVVVTMSLGAGAYVALTAGSGGSSSEPTVLAGSTPAGESGLPDPTDEVSGSGGGTASAGSSDPGASGRPETPGTTAPTTGVTPGPATRPVPETGSPSLGTATTDATATTGTTGTTPETPSPPSPETSTTTEDVTPPDTSLSEEFPEADGGEFWLSATEPASFACSLDEAAYTPCDSYTRLSDLDPGWHTLAVRATDAAGNTDPSPAETTWLATMSIPTDD